MVIDWAAVVDGGIPVLAGIYGMGLGYGFIRSASINRKPGLVVNFKWLGPLLIAFGIFLGFKTHAHNMHPSAREIAEAIASRVKLPKKIDNITILDAIDGKQDMIIYRFRITAPVQRFGGHLNAEHKLKDLILGKACSDTNFKEILKNGYSLEMRYKLEADPEDVLISVPPKLCGY